MSLAGPGDLPGSRYVPPPPPPPPPPVIHPVERLPVLPVRTPPVEPRLPAQPANDRLTQAQALDVPPPITPPAALMSIAQPAIQLPQGTPPVEGAPPSPGGGSGVRIETSAELGPVAGAVTAGQESLNGNTHYTASMSVGPQLSVGTPGGARAPVGGEVSTQAGGVVNFEVIAPDDMPPAQLTTINPFDVRTLPAGVQVKVDLGGFTGTAAEGHAQAFAAQYGMRAEQGVTWTAERGANPDEAKIAIGDYRAGETSGSAGVTNPALEAAGGVGVQIGNIDQNRENRLIEQQLDLSAGQLRPTSTQIVNQQEYVSSGGINVSLGPVRVDIGVGETAALTEVTQQADGTRQAETTLYYGSAAPVTINRSFNPDGSEQTEQRTYQYTLQVEDNNRDMLHLTMGGSANDLAASPLRPGQTMVLTYDQQQMRQLQGDFAAANGVNPLNQSIGATSGYRLPNMDADMSFAIGMVRNGPGVRNSAGLTDVLFSVAEQRDGRAADMVLSANPGSAWIIDGGAAPVLFQPGGVR